MRLFTYLTSIFVITLNSNSQSVVYIPYAVLPESSGEIFKIFGNGEEPYMLYYLTLINV